MKDAIKSGPPAQGGDKQVLVASIRDEIRVLLRLLADADLPATRHMLEVTTAAFLDELIRHTEYGRYGEMVDMLASEANMFDELELARTDWMARA